MSEEQNAPMRRIMNSNVGVNNVIESDDIMKTMMNTFDDIANILSKHCGPYSNYAIITDPTNPLAEPVFTKDGINIVRALEYASPMQEFIKRNLAYIGSRVESAASDGTTSAMIVTANALKYILEKISKLATSSYELEHLFKTRVVDKVKEMYASDKGYSFKKEWLVKDGVNMKDVVRYLAYCQVFTSSHGDTELANAVADLFANTPEQAWSYMHIEKAKYETNEKYRIEIDNTQWRIENARMFPLNKMVDDFGTSYKQTDADWVIANRTPNVGDMDTDNLRKLIEEAIKTGRPFVVITNDNLDSATNMWLNELFAQYPNHNTVFILVPQGEYGMNSDTSFIPLLTGKVPESENYLSHLNCKYDGHNFDIISGLYEPDNVDDNESRMHYFLKDKEKYKVYNETIDYLDKCIEAQKKAVATRQTNAALSHLMKIRNKLTIINRAAFIIGGSAYDNAAAVDIVSDAIPAVKHILTEGFVQAGFRSLYRAMMEIHGKMQDKRRLKWNTYTQQEDKEYQIVEAFLIGFCISIENLHRTISESTKTKTHTHFHPEFNEDILSGKPAEFTVKRIVQSKRLHKDNIVIMQPIKTDITLIERFGEVALKFLKACRVITPGGVVLHNQEK